MAAVKQFSDGIEFELSEMDISVANLVIEMSAPAKWAAINAIRHLNRSWKLRHLDPEMAVFRAITAEEESATALFHVLKRRCYDGADKLKPRDHIQKNAVIPFFDAITRVMAKSREFLPLTEFLIDENEKPRRLVIRFLTPHPSTGEELWAYPQPPLNFSMKEVPKSGPTRTMDFSAGLEEVVSSANVKTMIDHLRTRANLRNQILYAAGQGYPGVEGDIERGLRDYQRNVFAILKMCLLIEPYENKQLFVQQAIYSFLRVVKALPEDFEF